MTNKLIGGLIIAVFALTAAARAESTSFISTLNAENKAASGIVRLTERQAAALDFQVQREIATAHQGDTVAFSTSFTHRRTPAQRTEAGLDRLMTPELAQLDRLVATAVANRPPSTSPLLTTPATTSTSADAVETIPLKAEVHGEVSLSYIWGSGGAHGYASSIVTTVTDPSGKGSLTVGLSQFNGKGFRHSPYYYYPGEYACDRGW
jgi:hypothetical protein